MTSGGFALNGPKQRPAHLTWRLFITIRRNIMALNAIHPGEHLAEELKELGMSAAELARQLDVPTNRVTQILNGRRFINRDTALRLAHFFGTAAEFWLNGRLRVPLSVLLFLGTRCDGLTIVPERSIFHPTRRPAAYRPDISPPHLEG